MSILLRDTRASCDTHYFAASLARKSISIWRSDSTCPIATVQPGFSGGKNRHFIDPVNRLIYSGTWEDGLTCYDYAENRVVWHRSDLIGIQTVNLSAGFPSSVFVTLEAPDYRLDEPGVISGIVELSGQDGSTMWKAEDGDWIYVHPRQPLLVIQERCNDLVRFLDSEKNLIGSAPMVNFAIIEVGFAENMIALAEGAKGVRILDYNGTLISQYAPKMRRPNVIGAAFSGGCLNVFDSGDDAFVTIIEPATGRVITEYKRESRERICFIDDGTRFVDSSGLICRSVDGQPETKLQAEQAMPPTGP